MNTEIIKVKAKKRDGSTWVEGGLVTYNDRAYIVQLTQYIPDTKDSNIADYFGDNPQPYPILIEVDPNTVCRNTGLKDISGNDIWENDVVRFTDFVMINGSRTHKSKVEWKTEIGGFVIHAAAIGYYNVNPAQVEQFSMNIVGNIFDNPELKEEVYYE